MRNAVDHYEYQSLGAYLRPPNISELQSLGENGWELIQWPSVRSGQAPQGEYVLRRPKTSGHEPSSWEYRCSWVGMDAYGPDWHEHLSSCGWVSVGVELIGSGGSMYILKRPGSYRGTDDGDVSDRLVSLGYTDSSAEVVLDILRVKWEQSVENGHNIGTYAAVRFWLGSVFIPRSLAEFGCSKVDLPPEALVEEILNFKRVSGEVSLQNAVRQWCDIRRQDA